MVGYDIYFPAAVFCVAAIHPIKITGKQGSLFPTGTGPDLDDPFEGASQDRSIVGHDDGPAPGITRPVDQPIDDVTRLRRRAGSIPRRRASSRSQRPSRFSRFLTTS